MQHITSTRTVWSGSRFITSTPSALAAAAAKTLGWKGEKPMTYEEFVSMMERYQHERAALPPGTWSAQARAWCETGGILNDGRYGSQVTREELAQALYNLAGKGR